MSMKIELDYLHRLILSNASVEDFDAAGFQLSHRELTEAYQRLMEQIEELEATVSELEESIEAKDDKILELAAEVAAFDDLKSDFYHRIVTPQLDTPEEFLRLEGWYTAP